MTRSPCPAARASVLALAALLLLGAAADPSGLFVPIGWTGHPIALWWWWIPYAIQLPLWLGLAYAGARAVLDLPARGPWRRAFALWALMLVAGGLAAVAAGAALLLPLAFAQRYVLPAASSAAFVVWACGYTVLKTALIAAVPALVGALLAPRVPAAGAAAGGAAARPIPLSRPTPPATPTAIAGLALLLLALLGPWLAGHWWQGGPLGYAYADLLAPTPRSGAPGGPLALLLVGAALLFGLRGGARGAGLAPRLGAAASAAVGASVALWLVQALLLWNDPDAQRPGEQWWVPALVVRGLDAASFAVVLATLAGLATLLAARLPRHRHADASLWVLALLIAAGTALRPGAAGETAAAGLAPASGATVASTPAAAATAPPPAAVHAGLPRLRVAATPDGPRLVDPQGTPVVLHGVNVNQLGEYFKRDPSLPATLPLEAQDFADMAALGMNVVRLTLSWSRLEPQPGQVSDAYIARIRTAVDWARAHGVYVLLDMHQDGWGVHVDAPPGTVCRPGADPMVGWDGAPLWATLTDGTDPCQVTGRDMAPNVARAFESFYMDRAGIQSHLVAAWARLAAAFAADSTVVGYDLLNEPNFAETPPLASTLLLANYHARAIRAVRAAEAAQPGGFAHPVFVEPSIFWSGFGVDNLPPRDFTPDRQLVFAPHLYNESITSDQDLGVNFVSIERGDALAAAAARRLGMPLWIGEWGFFKSPEREAPLLARELAAEADRHVGSAFWVWKQSCSDPHVYPGSVAGNLRQWRCPTMQEIGTQRAIATPLSQAALRGVPDASARLARVGAALQLQGRAATPACTLTLWVPGDADPREVEVLGAHRADATRVPPGQASLGPSGGWLLRYCTAGGDYRVTLAAP